MNIQRLHGGNFVIAPTKNSWETRGTSNSGAVFLEHDEAIFDIVERVLGYRIRDDERLKDGLVICLYSANGVLPSDPVSRQRRGLAVLSPELELCYRHNKPILSPDTGEDSVDLLGIEDARVTYTDGKFFIWYCGYNGKYGMPCCAWSTDLIRWTKIAPLTGGLGEHENKDHVIFPYTYDNKWWMLHRPWGHEIPDANNYVIRLASAPTPYGPWEDKGEAVRGIPDSRKRISWVGGGAVPLRIADGKYFVLYHNGCFFHDGYREYDACACIIDLSRYGEYGAGGVVVDRLEPLMIPETENEKNADLRIDIIFPMSAHVYKDKLYFLYGAGDKATCAACVPVAEVEEIFKIKLT